MKFTQKTLLAAALATTTLFACNQTENKNAQDVGATNTENNSFVNLEGVVQLNDTEKWKANPETNEGIAKLRNYVAAFKTAETTDIAAYNQLAVDLKVTLGEIFEQCTMTGDAHQELHDYLAPILDYIKALRGPDVSAAQYALDDLERYFEKYDTYFE